MTTTYYNSMLKNQGDVLIFEEEKGGAQWFCTAT